ncbi:MAG: SusD/RagB family nutrient-binding outer membrane lipoprotein [Ferruginibacter sp.]
MRKRIIYPGFVLLAIILFSCTKGFLDINKDPNNPTSIAVSKLLPTAERSLAASLGLSGGNVPGMGQVLATYVHQGVVREEPFQYGATGTDYYLVTSWDNLYSGQPLNVNGSTLFEGSLQNLQVIITDATAKGDLQYAGIAQILKAYTFSQLVDMFGDVPFSEALKLKDGIVNPVFDKGADIYPKLFSLLDSGITNLKANALNSSTPGSDDVIYGGNISKWEKAANTIKLKLLLQQRLIKNVAADVNTLLTAGNLISTTTESFVMPYGVSGATDDRNPGFQDYFATQRGNYISPWFYSILKGYNPKIFTNIVDPRIPYYFYNQLTATAPADNPTEYRDTGFLSIVFGSIGPSRDFLQDNSISLYGIYPVGGRYDDGGGGSVNSNSGTGAAPYRFITYADRLYMEAELIKTGVITGDAAAKLQQAIQESFKEVDYVVTKYVKPTQTVPALSGTGAATAYINKIMAYYNNNASKQLEIIMTQKWIAAFGNFVDEYTDYRRTRFPVLFDPNDVSVAPNHLYQPPVNGDLVNSPGAQPAIPVQLSRDYPLTLPWSQNELNANKNAPAQKQPSTYKPFWLP